MTGRGGVDFAAFEVRIGWQRPLEPTQDGKKKQKKQKTNKSHKEGPSVSEGAGAGESRETPDDSPLMWFAGNDRCWGETRTSSLMHGNIRRRGPYLVFEHAHTFTHSHTTFSP